MAGEASTRLLNSRASRTSASTLESATHRGASRTVVEQRHLSEEVSRAELGDLGPVHEAAGASGDDDDQLDAARHLGWSSRCPRRWATGFRARRWPRAPRGRSLRTMKWPRRIRDFVGNVSCHRVTSCCQNRLVLGEHRVLLGVAVRASEEAQRDPGFGRLDPGAAAPLRRAQRRAPRGGGARHRSARPAGARHGRRPPQGGRRRG